MKMLLLVLLFNSSCTSSNIQKDVTANDTAILAALNNMEAGPIMEEHEMRIPSNGGENDILTGNTTPVEIVAFAKTLIGTPYLYASSHPAKGFDCSGFITYVFNHFDISVPRSSVGFTNVGQTVSLQQAMPGDLILFTGTDNSIRVVGHMGIITDNNNGAIRFIHSTSGKQYGVTITPLEKYYMGRFVKVIRVFNNERL